MNKKFLASAMILFAVFGFLFAREIKAGSEHNVSGFAWSENIGWISFNSTNCDIDGDGIYKGAGETGGPAPAGCPISGPVSSYGVSINSTTGVFSGYAWSENIGWISFNRSDTGAPPEAPYNGSETFIAKADLSTGEVSGWARALSNGGGWDGWIKLRGVAGGTTPYGVSINTSTGDFSGWAWSDMVVGWISFNCEDGGYNEATGGYYNICSTSNYKVVKININTPPSANTLQIDNFANTVCGYTTGARVRFKWIFDDAGDTQSAYQIQADDNSGFTSPIEFDSGKIPLNSQEFINDPPAYPLLSWGTTYYWRLKVWDSSGTPSTDWIYPSPTFFTTPGHAYPTVNFSWEPQKATVDENVSFTDLSTANGATIASRSWVFPDGDPATSGEQNPITKFSSSGNKTVTLTITDSSGFQCDKSILVGIQRPLPNWKEIAPFKSSFSPLKNIFASILNAFSWFKNPF